MRCTLPTLLATLLLVLPVMASAQVYKWKDAHDTIHFSDSPPPSGVKYTVLKTRPNADKPRVAARTSDAAGNQGLDSTGTHASSGSDTQTARDSQLKRFCAQIKSNIELLQSSQAMGQINTDGRTVALSPKMRAHQLQQQQQRYKAYCGT